MTARIREFLKRRKDEGPCLVVDLDVVRDNYDRLRQGAARHQGLLRRQGQSGAGNPEAAGRARRLLRRRLGRRDRDGAGRRRHARPHLLRQPDQEGERDRRGLQARRHAVRDRLRGRGREGRARRARQPRDLPHPLRRRRRRLAAVAQVRLRAGLRRRHPGACPPAGPGRRTASRSMSAPSRTTSRPGTARSPRPPRSSAPAPSAASTSRWSTWAAASRPSTSARRRSSNPTARRSSARCASTSATPSRTPSSSPAAASSAMPA